VKIHGQRYQGVCRVPEFARLVSLACHDLRTPLATVRGFAKTLERTATLEEPESRYVELIDAASGELATLLDLLGLAARVEAGRYEVAPVDVETEELARAVATEVGEEQVAVTGTGTATRLDQTLVRTALTGLVRGALRHGGLERVELRVDGVRFELAPVSETLAPILLGDELRDLGAAVGVHVLRHTGGSVEVAGETLLVAPATEAE
jgi:signal transduction histidine kinase